MSNQLQQRIAQLSPVQRAQLEQQIKLKTQNHPVTNSIASRNSTEELSISFAQQRLWFLSLLEPESTLYNRPAHIQIQGQLNISILDRCLNEIVRRHQVLRTNFSSVNGQQKVVIKSTCNLSLTVIDFSLMAIDLQQTNLHQLLQQSAQFQFDLAQDCLMQLGLVKLSADEHVLLLTFHHSVFDGWSMEVLLAELATLYNAFSQDKISPLPDLVIQYADFASWQSYQFRHLDYQTKLDYWKQQLGGELPILELPIDRPRPAIQTFRGARYIHTVSLELTHALKQLSQKQNATLFMTLLAVYQILLHRYSEQTDIIVGTPISGRDRLETENLIGVFINILALRINLAENPSFIAVLDQVQRVALAAHENQEIPFEKLVEELQPVRSLSHSPIFQTLFQLRKLPKTWQTNQGLKFAEIKTERDLVGFDISLDITETTAGLVCQFEYNTDLFEHATIERMAGHFQTLLTGIIANPATSIGQLPLLTSAERQQILVDWHDPAIDYPDDQCIHQLFEDQVKITPEAVAVVCEDRELTYQELNHRANQLAHYLQKLGVKPDVLVGICLARSPEMIVALLGVLKAGGAYVPIDPNYPQERLDWIIADAEISILLTQVDWIDICSQPIAQTVCLDRDWSEIARQPDRDPICAATPAHLAYLIYTSGSTGTPKGVMVQHNSVVNFTRSVVSDYRLGREDRVLQFASINFDAAVEEIYPCLSSGGTLVLRTDRMIDSVSHFLATCRNWHLTVLGLPTAYWHQIVTELATGAAILPESLRLVVIGGEQVLFESIETWQSCVGKYPHLVNTYGPTEGTVVATTYPIDITDTVRRSVPIGKAISNVQTYILDTYLQPVPIGIPGELHLGGAGLARGYWHRPELTTEKFIPNPFQHNDRDRLYKTGDLVRYLPDGQIEFLGRIDHQVKIRGFRIELGEIESVLSQHPDVLNAIAIAREDSPGDKQLIAYVVPQPSATLTQTELRQFLNQKLPDYMLPGAVVVLDQFPLTPNGKIDRQNLPAPDRIRLASESTFIAPRNQVEQQLAKIWSELLKMKSIGIQDNFFELGGHSLLAMRVMSRIQTVYSLNMPLRDLFEYPTIEQLSDRINLTIGGQFPLESDSEYEQGEI